MDITTLNRKLGSLKAKATDMETYLADHEKCQCSPEVKKVIEIKLSNCELLRKSIEDLRGLYFELPDTVDTDKYDHDLRNLEARVDEIEVNLDCFRTRLFPASNITGPNSGSRVLSVKLPEIPLPQFSGLYEDWDNFKHQFQALISKNEKLDGNQKLFYLNAALKGPAKLLQTSADTFDSLFKALTSRYENKRLIVDSHIQSILKLERVANESYVGLRHLIDSTRKAIRALEFLKFNLNNLAGAIFINILLQKIDRESRKLFEMSLKSNEVPELENLLGFLEKRSQLLDNFHKNTVEV